MKTIKLITLQIINDCVILSLTLNIWFNAKIDNAKNPDVGEYASIVPIIDFSSGNIKLQGIIILPLKRAIIILNPVNIFILVSLTLVIANIM